MVDSFDDIATHDGEGRPLPLEDASQDELLELAEASERWRALNDADLPEALGRESRLARNAPRTPTSASLAALRASCSATNRSQPSEGVNASTRMR